MPDTLTIIRRRRGQRERRRQSADQRGQRLVMGAGFFASVFIAVLIIAAALGYAEITNDLPSIEQLPILLNPPDGLLLQPTTLYDRSGEHLLTTLSPFDGPRRYIPLSPQNPQHLPQSLVDATTVLLDPGFWTHPGYSLEGLDNPDYHPTLAQRLVANLLLWNEPASLRRALRERFLAAQITAQYGRQQVMEWYLNCADYGHYTYGIEQAARLYFGKSADELTLAEAATLAAVNQAPALNPQDAPQAAAQRGKETLQTMRMFDLITDADLNAAEIVTFASAPAAEPGLSPAFVKLALSQLETYFGNTRLERGGVILITTLDYDLQQQSTCLLQKQVIPDFDTTKCAATAFLPNLPSIPDAALSALILDPGTGQILAAVGETRSDGESSFLAEHDAGSLLTPFIYLTGFTRGLNPASLSWDIPDLTPITNLDGQYHGPLRLREALNNDYLVPAAQILTQMGGDNVSRTAASFGLELPEDDLWLSEPEYESPLKLAAAYGVFASNGVLTGQPLNDDFGPVAVLTVTGVDHADWLDWRTPQAQAVVTPQLAYLMTHVLSDASVRNTGVGINSLLDIGRPVGVKVGQTWSGTDTWAIGYTPQRVVLVWAGSEAQPSPRLSVGLWHALTRYATWNLQSEGWTAPAGISMLPVCSPSGMLPTEACPNVVNEVFLSGNEPIQSDTLYRVYQVNRETKLLATVFTPPDLVDEKVYLVVPPEAQDWAQANAYDTPPTSYDTIQPPEFQANVNITSPAMFASTRGVVTITGTATADDFDYYSVQVGQGLNPQTWMQVGEGESPVQGDKLAEWDTTNLSGLYAIQLLVVHGDQHVEKAVIQVTVDNQPPNVTILNPQERDELEYASNRRITFQVQADDDMQLKEISFFMDNQLVTTLYASPYVTVWTASVGKHTLLVVATDSAGNVTEASVGFDVVR